MANTYFKNNRLHKNNEVFPKSVAAWSANLEYNINDFCSYNNKIYYSLVNNNLNNAILTNPLYWKEYNKEEKIHVLKSYDVSATGTLPILWNKLGSPTEVTNSEIGIDFAEVGTPTYAPCKFGNGSRSETGKYVEATIGGLLNLPAWTISMWVKYTDYGVTNGDTGSTAYSLLSINSPGATVGTGGFLAFDHRGDGNRTDLYIVPATTTNLSMQITTGLNIAQNDLVFYAIVFDTSQSSPNRLRLFYYNQTSGASNIFTETNSTTVGTAPVPSFGVTHVIRTQVWAEAIRGANALIDNIKIYNYAKTDFSDRNTEGIAVVNNCTVNHNENSKELFVFNRVTTDELAISEIVISNESEISITLENPTTIIRTNILPITENILYDYSTVTGSNIINHNLNLEDYFVVSKSSIASTLSIRTVTKQTENSCVISAITGTASENYYFINKDSFDKCRSFNLSTDNWVGSSITVNHNMGCSDYFIWAVDESNNKKVAIPTATKLGPRFANLSFSNSYSSNLTVYFGGTSDNSIWFSGSGVQSTNLITTDINNNEWKVYTDSSGILYTDMID